jgi:alanine racemase
MREARIDLGALAHNVGVLRERVAPAQTMVIVKADAYGHGAVESARAAVGAGTEWLGVVDIPEALELRGAGIRAPILTWLHGADSDFEAAVAAGIDIGISTLDQLERAAATPGLAQVQIKIDTGLSRNGVEPGLATTVFERAAQLEAAGRLRVRAVWSHLANAGEADDREQLERFESALLAATDAGLTPDLRHIAATAGALTRPAARLDLVRLGLGAYGLSPLDGESSDSLGLRPVMQLSAEIVSVKRVPADSGVSYNYTYRTARETNVVLVPLGYADGIPRAASSVAPVSINGTTYRISGRVAMDQFVVDVGDDEVRVGDRAILFGDGNEGVPTADDWAEACGTINYEIVTRLGPRVTRVFVP